MIRLLNLLSAGETQCLKEAKGSESAEGPQSLACDKTGGYAPLQCDQSSGNCWCVDRLGREISRTRRSDGLHDCDAMGKHVFVLKYPGFLYYKAKLKWKPLVPSARLREESVFGRVQCIVGTCPSVGLWEESAYERCRLQLCGETVISSVSVPGGHSLFVVAFCGSVQFVILMLPGCLVIQKRMTDLALFRRLTSFQPVRFAALTFKYF